MKDVNKSGKTNISIILLIGIIFLGIIAIGGFGIFKFATSNPIENNETIQNNPNIDYQTASNTLQSTPVVVWIILSWLIPLITLFVVGVSIKARSPNGHITSKPMILSPNFWYIVLIFGLLQLVFLIFLIFPLWLKPFT